MMGSPRSRQSSTSNRTTSAQYCRRGCGEKGWELSRSDCKASPKLVPFVLGVKGGVGGVWNGGGTGMGVVEESRVMDEVEGAIRFLRMRRSSLCIQSANPKDWRISKIGPRAWSSSSFVGTMGGITGSCSRAAKAPSQGVSTKGQSVSPRFSGGCGSQPLSIAME
jgi:hypothetical protein